MKKTYLLIILFFAFETLSAQVTLSLDSDERDVSELFIGFNRRSDPGSWWTNSSFHNLLEQMNPDIVRYPAGTQANYWDWRTGKFMDNPDKSWNNKEVVTIPTFVNALPDRTKIVYVVNLARPTPATGISLNASEQVLKSNATLNLKIADMLDAIQEFVSQGKTPYAVEIGNEFYFGNEESGIFHIVESNGKYYSGWNFATNQPYESNNKAYATIPIAKLYLKQSKEIVSAIKSNYPNIKILLTTTKGGSAARDSWNNTIFNELTTNANYTSLKANTYGVTQHHYLNDNYGVQSVISDNNSAKTAIAEGIQYPLDKLADYNMVPSDYKIWYTEYGEVKHIADETWASAVRYAALVYSWISLGDKVGQLGYHHLTDETVIKTDNPMKFAPVGMAAEMVSKAASEMTSLKEINFTNNPVSTNNVRSLYGYKFKNQEKETLFIINTSNTNFSNISFSSLFTYNGQPEMTQYHSNTPYVSGVYKGHSNILSNSGNISNTIDIKKFSITVIESKNTALSIDDFETKDVMIYPNPTKDIIRIKNIDVLESVAITDIKGSIIYQSQTIVNNTLEVRDIKKGIYFLEIKTNKGLIHRKLVKQ